MFDHFFHLKERNIKQSWSFDMINLRSKLTRKINATNIFTQHFVSRANINAIYIYMYATRYTLYKPIIILHSIHHFWCLNSAAQNDRAACTVSSWGETIQIGSWRRTPRHMLWLEIVEDQFTVTQWLIFFCERRIHCRRPARCQTLTWHQYLLCFFFVSVYIHSVLDETSHIVNKMYTKNDILDTDWSPFLWIKM